MGRFLGFLLYFLPILAASGGAHWLVATWAMRAFPRLARHSRWVKVLVALLVVAAPVARIATHRTHQGWLISELMAASLVEAMFVLFSLPLLVAAIALSRLVTRRTVAPTPTPTNDADAEAEAAARGVPATEDVANKPAPPLFGRREALERATGMLALGATGSVLGWGIVRGRHAFQIDELVVRIPGLPKALDGYVIAQVSDLHAGVQVTDRDLREGLDRVAETKADLIVVTGDLVDFDNHYAPMLARALGALRARDGVFAILGNHDYYAGPGELRAILGKTDVNVLVNRGRVIRPGDGGGFALVGVDDIWARSAGGEGPDLDGALAQVPADIPRILLAHQPQFVRHSAGRVALQLSGHTHGGQINPGFTPARLFLPFIAGRYDIEGTVLYVNRGFGVVGPPARIGAPPEVTKVVLVSA